MLETFAVIIATLMIPTSPLNSMMPETYSGYSEPNTYIQQANVGAGIVLTPEGSDVPVTYEDEYVNETNRDLFNYCFVGGESEDYYTGDYYNLLDEKVTLKDKNIYSLADPTTKYNGLAFAFYMYWEGVSYDKSACWMKNYSYYLNDGSYVYVDEPQVNDIIIYYSGYADESGNDKVITAGVVTQVFESEASDPASNEAFVKQLSKLEVQSMWGYFGIYEHRGDLCPFVGKYATDLVTDSATAKVQYLRRHTTHNFKAVSGSNNGTTHTEQCTECGKTEQKSHSYDNSYGLISGFTESLMHKAYCACGARKTEKHTFVTFYVGTKPYTYCTKCHWSEIDHEILTKLGIVLS